MPDCRVRPYPTDLSDAEWATLEPLVASTGAHRPAAEAAPAPHDRGDLLSRLLWLCVADAAATFAALLQSSLPRLPDGGATARSARSLAIGGRGPAFAQHC